MLSVSEANLMLLGTGIGVLFWLLVVAVCASHVTGAWARVGLRILGSWIAASAILVLALRLGPLGGGALGGPGVGEELVAVVGDLLDRVGQCARILGARDRRHAADDEGRNAVDAGLLG